MPDAEEGRGSRLTSFVHSPDGGLALGLMVVLTLGVFILTGSAVDCPGFHMYSQLAGEYGRVEAYLDRACPNLPYDQVRTSLYWDFGLIVFYSSLLWAALTRWWKAGWRTEGLRNRFYLIRWFPLAAGCFDAIENILLLLTLGSTETGVIAFERFTGLSAPYRDPGWLITALAWPKWLLITAAILGLVLARIGAAGFYFGKLRSDTEALPDEGESNQPQSEPAVDPATIGVCLSGGGIRSASFSLGALEAFDEEHILERTSWVTSVSGGGYAASAWFIAGGARGLLKRDRTDPNLFKYIRKHRRYLAMGRGGLPTAVVTAVSCIIVNVLLLATLAYVVAYPLGRLVSWFPVKPALRDSTALDFTWRLWAPGLLPLALALVAVLFSLPWWDPSRQKIVKISGICAAYGVLILGLLVFLPWALVSGLDAVAAVGERLTSDETSAESGSWFLGLLSALGVTAALTRIATKPLSKNAPRLGGVLLALGVVLYVGWVALAAATGSGFLGSSWVTYILIFTAFSVAYWFLNAQFWSLNALYDTRLRTTFATTTNRSARTRGAPSVAGVYPVRRKCEFNWDQYETANKPELIICAAAQRRDASVTGIPAISFVFSSKRIGLYKTYLDEGKLRVEEHFVHSNRFVRATKGRLRKVSAAASISGAALSSAMGRHSLGTTNALLAALNLSLGMWLPNPKFIPTTGPVKRVKRPRLSYRVKEILGTFDIENDPYVYVTDGGHWENLGLVELIRRRCPTIFCVDASGDQIGKFGTLREAIQLASLECMTDIVIDLEPLRPNPDTGLSSKYVAVGTICYPAIEGGPDKFEGKLYYIKAGVAKGSGIELRSFGVRDKTFPRYSTGDQFLSDEEFVNLVELGYEAASEGVWMYNNPLSPEEEEEENEAAEAPGDNVCEMDSRSIN